MSETLQLICDAARPYGLNLVAAIPIDRYDFLVPLQARASTMAPAMRSIVLIGNGGGTFWRALCEYARERPGWWERENPLDDFTHQIVERDIEPRLHTVGLRCKAVYPVMANGPSLNFIELAKVAGLGGPSIAGVAVHPVYGPSIAFRVALLLNEELDEPGEALGFDPCPGCAARSCVSMCRSGAVTFPEGWNIARCLKHRVEVEADCAPRCDARAACVLGREHHYPGDELAYHQARALRAMRPYYEAHIKPRPAK